MKIGHIAGLSPRRLKIKELEWKVTTLFPDTPEGKLWAAVFLQAVFDAAEYQIGRLNDYHAADAFAYLMNKNGIFACLLAGVDSEYALRHVQRLGLLRCTGEH